jgi:glyoxylase-like metal-dependent hydrolase (beta-lactamase superfamily II)
MINCFLVREEDGLTLVDTGLRGSSEPILEAARQTGLPIRRIVLTHAHLDHIGALDRLGRALPGVAMAIGGREAKLLGGDFSLEPGETGKRLRGFLHVNTRPTRTLKEGDLVASLRAVASPGHTPGHMSFLDVRDGTLLCGDAFTTQTGLLAAGVFKPFFPFPALFSWNRERSALSARHLRDLKPAPGRRSRPDSREPRGGDEAGRRFGVSAMRESARLERQFWAMEFAITVRVIFRN